jgi:hypothetical protein
MKNDKKNPEIVDFETAAYKHPNEIKVKIIVVK